MRGLALTSEQVALVAALLSLVASIGSGVISLYTARLRRFSSERWWERKAQSYADLFQALFYAKLMTAMRLEELLGESRYNEAYKAEIEARSTAGFLEIRKAATTGAFLFSKEADKILQELLRAIDDPRPNHDQLEELEETLSALTMALDQLRPFALRDLKLS